MTGCRGFDLPGRHINLLVLLIQSASESLEWSGPTTAAHQSKVAVLHTMLSVLWGGDLKDINHKLFAGGLMDKRHLRPTGAVI